ncbi:hypothetical protein R1sor_005825 [Riccia sorocarpa]|uniref:RING-type E3 ubiquitin transferase n=1 Tax=Riccia sorocarpa TaxID=122646 RepID=A0ABD3HPC4_9MARC
MGGMCCCPGREDFDELTSFPGRNLYERCYCLRCCARWCLRTYASWFDPGEGQDSSPPVQGNAPAAAGLLEAEPLRRSSSTGDGGGGEALTQLGGVRGGPVAFDELPQTYRPDSPGKRPSKLMSRSDSLGNLDPEDDICPTCLEGYDKENPRIITDCGHHFHLACIYEWAERSKHCPVCGQEMHFNEYSENV